MSSEKERRGAQMTLSCLVSFAASCLRLMQRACFLPPVLFSQRFFFGLCSLYSLSFFSSILAPCLATVCSLSTFHSVSVSVRLFLCALVRSCMLDAPVNFQAHSSSFYDFSYLVFTPFVTRARGSDRGLSGLWPVARSDGCCCASLTKWRAMFGGGVCGYCCSGVGH